MYLTQILYVFQNRQSNTVEKRINKSNNIKKFKFTDDHYCILKRHQRMVHLAVAHYTESKIREISFLIF